MSDLAEEGPRAETSILYCDVNCVLYAHQDISNLYSGLYNYHIVDNSVNNNKSVGVYHDHVFNIIFYTLYYSCIV